MSSIQRILDEVSETILQRGEDVYSGESILSLSKNSEGVYTSNVCGSGGDTYKVQVQTNGKGEVSAYSCTCPYDYGDICKHIVAVLLAIEVGNFSAQNDLSTKAGKGATPAADLPELLNALPREKLISIILAQAEEDERFKSNLTLEVAPPDTKNDLMIVKEKIRRAIRSNTHRGFIDYVGCDAVCVELSDCLDLAESRLAKGQALSAFEITLYVLLKGADLASSADSSSGSLTMVMDESFEKLERICRQIVESSLHEDGKYCYERLCKEALNKVFIGWSDWSFDLLKIAALMVTEKNKGRIDSALNSLRERDTGHTYSDYSQTEEDLIKLKIIQILEGEKPARAFIDERLGVDQFRELAVEEDLRKGDYENAERLCLEKIKQGDRRPFGRPSDWWYRLYKIYEETNDRDKLLSTAKSLLLQGDIEYYRKMKAFLLEEGRWQEDYPLLLAEIKTAQPGFLYTQILDQENEHALLLEEVKRNISSVFLYGKKLSKHYPAVIHGLFSLEIIRAARKSRNRGEYKRVCGLLRELYQADGKEEALALADEFMLEYKRRPAMLDELANLKRKLAESL